MGDSADHQRFCEYLTILSCYPGQGVLSPYEKHWLSSDREPGWEDHQHAVIAVYSLAAGDDGWWGLVLPLLLGRLRECVYERHRDLSSELLGA